MAQKTVLITGTSTGIGATTAEHLAKAGWKVYAGVRKADDGARLVEAIDGDIVPVILDVTKAQDIANVVKQIDSDVGSLHGLVNNAGIPVASPVELTTDEAWRWPFEVNFFGAVNLTREVMPLVDRVDGRFVHVGSIACRVSGVAQSPYSATKHALVAFNWSLRAELQRNTGMNSSLIEPGGTKTAIVDKANGLIDDLNRMIDSADRRGRYQFVVDGFKGFVTEGFAKAVEPDHCAKAIEHALTAKRPKARYLVGPDAKVAGHFVTKMPDRIRERMDLALAKKFEKSGRALP